MIVIVSIKILCNSNASTQHKVEIKSKQIREMSSTILLKFNENVQINNLIFRKC